MWVLLNFRLRDAELVLAAARDLSSPGEYYIQEYVRDLAKTAISSAPREVRLPAALRLARALRDGAGVFADDFRRAIGLLATPELHAALASPPPEADAADLETVRAALASLGRS